MVDKWLSGLAEESTDVVVEAANGADPMVTGLGVAVYRLEVPERLTNSNIAGLDRYSFDTFLHGSAKS